MIQTISNFYIIVGQYIIYRKTEKEQYMKKLYFLIFLSFLGFHLSSLNILAQNCTQLSLPDNAFARLCIPSGYGGAEDLDFSPDGQTLASLIYRTGPASIVLWDIKNKVEKLTINFGSYNDGYGISIRFSPDGKTFVCGDKLYDASTGEPKLLLLDGEGYRDYVIYSPDGKTLAGAGAKGIRFGMQL